MALAGPWGHVPEVLAHRDWKTEPPAVIAPRLGVPAWQSRFANTLEYREMVGWLRVAGLTGEQQRRARSAVRNMFLTRQSAVVRRRARKLIQAATTR
jgi:hypothetical protein